MVVVADPSGTQRVMQDEHGSRIVRGRVKWFDPAKGFGFVVADEGGPDILLHANVLRNYGQSSVADSATVEIEVQETARGVQATEVRAIEPPEGTASETLVDPATEEMAERDLPPLEPARVKWFDKAKGFGFANVFSSAEDIFIHIEVLRRSGLADLQPGEAVSLRVVEGRRGRMAMAVLPWEAALKDRK